MTGGVFDRAVSPQASRFGLPYLGVDKAGEPILLRVATESDAKAWLEHLKRITRETPWMLQSELDELPTLDEQRSNLSDYYTRPGAIAICAVRPHRTEQQPILGTITLASGRFRRTAHTAELSMGVGKAWWGLGIGSLLMKAVLHHAEQAAEIRRISLSVFSDNLTAYRLYKRVGFQDEGLLHRYVRLDDSYRDLIVMGYRVGI